MTVVDIGCGQNKTDGAIGIDVRDYDCVDYVCDIENGIPLPESSAETVIAQSILEHIEELEAVMREIHRVLKPSGSLTGKVPHYTDRNAYTDPTHCRFFSTDSFDYWDSSTCLGEMDYFEVEFAVYECRRIRRVQFWKSRPIVFELRCVK